MAKNTKLPLAPDTLTPEHIYMNRKQFLKAAGFFGAGALMAACAPQLTPAPTAMSPEATALNTATPAPTAVGIKDELGASATPLEDVQSFVNYYELSVSKPEAVRHGANLTTADWKLEIGGLVEQPLTLTMDEIAERYPVEERVYRMRCVEAWSMVIPWLGFELNRLLADVKPLAEAKYVAFESLFRPAEMPGTSAPYPWPYTEGLRLDEAMHPLTILSTGLYGKPLAGQNGAPIRLVVPWKYGFKSIKSLVKIMLTADEPPTFWNKLAANEYGFYSNVNPTVPHPRWPQATELRVAETGRRETLLFNGYGDQVASLYEGMDLKKNY